MVSKRARKELNILAALFLLVGAMFSMRPGMALVFHVLGVAFIIAGVYGIVCVMKSEKFLL